MSIPYRTRRTLRHLGIGALVLILVAVLVWMIWLLWLDRYVLYTRDGAILDFTLSDESLSGEVAKPPEQEVTISIYYNEGEDQLNISTDLAQMKGYYISIDMLREQYDEVFAIVKKLPAQTPVMLDVKDIVGRFYYTSSFGPAGNGVEQEKVDALIRFLAASDLYAIARVPALRDYYHGLNNVPDGLPTAGGYLWMESGTNCYWLNPSAPGTQTRLLQMVKELKALGFSEVVLSDFRFPQTDKIVFKADKSQALAECAKLLVESCADTRFAVSFQVESPTQPLPGGRSRMYLENQAAGEAKNIAQLSGLENPEVNLVFVTDVNDTRFDAYSALRPITTAQVE